MLWQTLGLFFLASSFAGGAAAHSTRSSVAGRHEPSSGDRFLRRSRPRARAVSERAVFAHFMMGNAQQYTAEAWIADVKQAKAAGFDAFAVNVGGDATDSVQLDLAYSAAEKAGNFGIFVSLDFVYTARFGSSANILATYLEPFASRSGQFKINGKPVLSTFSGETAATYLESNSDMNAAWSNFKSLAKQLPTPLDIFFMPFWTGIDGGSAVSKNPIVDGIGQWLAWPTTDAPPSTEIDVSFQKDALANGKAYIAPVSPWFYVHQAAGNNRIYRSDDNLLATRYEQLLSLDTVPDYIEVLTWNDYGESHYIGRQQPSANYPFVDVDSKLYAGTQFDHAPLLGLVAFYNQWYKTERFPTPSKTTRGWFYYRTHPKDLVATEDPLGRPDSADMANDVLQAAIVLSKSSKVTHAQFNSGGQASDKFELEKEWSTSCRFPSSLASKAL